MRLDLSNMPQCSTSISVQAHWDPIADSFSNLPNNHHGMPNCAICRQATPLKNMGRGPSEFLFRHLL